MSNFELSMDTILVSNIDQNLFDFFDVLNLMVSCLLLKNIGLTYWKRWSLTQLLIGFDVSSDDLWTNLDDGLCRQKS